MKMVAVMNLPLERIGFIFYGIASLRRLFVPPHEKVTSRLFFGHLVKNLNHLHGRQKTGVAGRIHLPSM